MLSKNTKYQLSVSKIMPARLKSTGTWVLNSTIGPYCFGRTLRNYIIWMGIYPLIRYMPRKFQVYRSKFLKVSTDIIYKKYRL